MVQTDQDYSLAMLFGIASNTGEHVHLDMLNITVVKCIANIHSFDEKRYIFLAKFSPSFSPSRKSITTPKHRIVS